MKHAAFLFLLLTPLAYAHLDSGVDRTVGKYLIDFGYAPKNLTAGQESTLSFNIVNTTTQKSIAPKDVWVRISGNDGIVFSGTFAPQPKNVEFAYTFPSGGQYDIDARFEGNNGTMTESTFAVTVRNTIPTALIGALALIIILSALLILRNDREKRARKA